MTRHLGFQKTPFRLDGSKVCAQVFDELRVGGGQRLLTPLCELNRLAHLGVATIFQCDQRSAASRLTCQFQLLKFFEMKGLVMGLVMGLVTDLRSDLEDLEKGLVMVKELDLMLKSFE